MGVAQDISYADDWFHHDPNTFGYETVYNNYMNWMQEFAASKAYMVRVPCRSGCVLALPHRSDAVWAGRCFLGTMKATATRQYA